MKARYGRDRIVTTPEHNPERIKLRVIETATQSYARLFGHIWIYLGQLALWCGIILSVAFAIGRADTVVNVPELLVALATLVVGLLALVGMASVCVGCHRAILLDEKPRLTRLFHVRGRELRYVGIWLICVVAFVAPSYGAISATQPRDALSLSFIGIGMLAWAAIIATFLALAFPAIATDRRQALRSAVRLSRGHRWRLLGLMVAVHVPLIVVGVAVSTLGSAAGLFSDVLSTVVQLLQILVLVAATSVAYQRIGGGAIDVAAVFD